LVATLAWKLLGRNQLWQNYVDLHNRRLIIGCDLGMEIARPQPIVAKLCGFTQSAQLWRNYVDLHNPLNCGEIMWI
jgi:hypothetical protein